MFSLVLVIIFTLSKKVPAHLQYFNKVGVIFQIILLLLVLQIPYNSRYVN